MVRPKAYVELRYADLPKALLLTPVGKVPGVEVPGLCLSKGNACALEGQGVVGAHACVNDVALACACSRER